MLLNVCKQTFHISYMRLSQNVKSVLMRNIWHIIFMWRRRILADFQICISVPLRNVVSWSAASLLKKKSFGGFSQEFCQNFKLSPSLHFKFRNKLVHFWNLVILEHKWLKESYCHTCHWWRQFMYLHINKKTKALIQWRTDAWSSRGECGGGCNTTCLPTVEVTSCDPG